MGKNKYLNLFSIIVSIFFFSSIYYYFYFIADHIIYQQNEKVLFLFDLKYFKNFLSYPGGLTEYSSNFLTQFFYLKWLGLAMFISLAFSASFLSHKIYLKLSDKPIPLIHLLPALLIAVLYFGQSLVLSLGYIFAASAFLAYLNITSEPGKYIFAISAFILMYFIAAAFAVVFLASAFIYELISCREKKRIPWLISYLFLGLLVPFVTWRFLFSISFEDAYLYLLPIQPAYGVPLANILFIFFLPLLPVISMVRYTEANTGKLKSMLKISLPLILLSLLTVFALNRSLNKDYRLILQIEKLAGEEKWIDMLQLSAKNPNSSDVIASYTNLALYKTGNLPWQMFRFYQLHNENGLILKWRNSADILMAGSDVYFNLGLNNGAYRWAFEDLVVEGTTYRALKRLVLTSIINKDYRVAEKYISVLNKTLFYKKWAKKYSRLLYNDSAVNSDPLLGKKVTQLAHDNSFITIINNEPNLKLLLESNPQNNMAFEYLMAHYLLKKDVEGFASEIESIRNFQYKELPSSYEEALLVYYVFHETDQIDLGNLSISEITRKRFNAYSEAYSKYKSNKDMAAKVMRKDFGDTYWYYHHFIDRVSIKETNSQKVDR